MEKRIRLNDTNIKNTGIIEASTQIEAEVEVGAEVEEGVEVEEEVEVGVGEEGLKMIIRVIRGNIPDKVC